MELAKRGDRVSINSRKRSYFFQGASGINLVAGQNEMGIIPDSISDDNLNRINISLRMNHLRLGWPEGKKTEIPKDETIGDILQQGRNKIEDFLYALWKNKSLKSTEKIAKVEKLLELEKAGKNKSGQPRVSVVSKIEYTLSNIAGVSPVQEGKKDEIKISITKGVKEENPNKEKK